MRALRYSFRSLVRNPAFSAVIVLLLAFGIGANTLIFTAVDVLLLRDLPVEHPEQLVRLQDVHPNGFRTYGPTFPLVFQTLLRERAKTLQDVFFAVDEELGLEAPGRIEVIEAEAVSGNYYRVLGVHPLLGRLIGEDDERNTTSNPVVLSYAFWKREFGGRRNVIGETIRLRGMPFTIIGVTPRGFHYLSVEGGVDLALSLHDPRPATFQGQIFARLRPGVSVAQGSAEIETLFPGMIDATLADSMRGTTLTADQQREFIASEKRNRGILDPMEHGSSILLRKQFAVGVKVLMGAVGALLLLVCANIAGLMLARGEASRKEIAVRLSLGATRFTIAAQLIVDALVLSILGAGAAMLVTRYGGPLLLRFLPSHRPTNLELAPDAGVLAFAAGICVVTAIAMSLVPALTLFRVDLTKLMGRGGPSQRRSVAGIVLVGLQVALSVILLVGGGALVHTLGQLRNADLGMDRHNFIVMVVKPWISSAQFRTQEQVMDAMKQVLLRARELPGVEGASLSSAPQMRGMGPKMSVQPAGTFIRDSDFLNTTFNNVTPGYFENAGIRILAGRDFRPADITTKKPVPVIVSAGFAKRFFPNQDPIGKTFGSGMNVTAGADSLIIGVVNDIRFRSMREEAAPIFYSAVDSFYGATLSVRTREAPGPVIAELRAMLASIGPGIAPSEVGTMEQDIETSLWQERLIAALASVFAIASAVLVAVGLYGMLAYSIARRTREIGIRMALGARPANLIGMITLDVGLSVGPGLLLGLIVYAMCARILAPVLYGVRPMDAVSICVSIVLIAVVAAIAGFVPARRAVSVEPSEALRQD